CKICNLEGTNQIAFDRINEAIENGEKMAKVVREINEEFGLNLTPMNASRHKKHYMEQKDAPKRKKNTLDIILPKPTGRNNITKVEVIENRSEIPKNIKKLIERMELEWVMFSEEFVKHFNQTEAYQSVYGCDRLRAAHGGSDLMKNPDVLQYISYLITSRRERTRVTADYVLNLLVTNAERCLQAVPVLDREGNEVGDWMWNAPALNKSAELLGKYMGMWDRSQQKDEDKQQYFTDILQMLIQKKINPITASYELDKRELPIPEGLKLAMKKVDPSQFKDDGARERDDYSNYSIEELKERKRVLEEEQWKQSQQRQ
ncbi:MAG: hypothetical protein GY866_21130, partial [Proteobacteria bacterium]|nr:hypothetical protein [Pseudomonadota bacterium]